VPLARLLGEAGEVLEVAARERDQSRGVDLVEPPRGPLASSLVRSGGLLRAPLVRVCVVGHGPAFGLGI